MKCEGNSGASPSTARLSGPSQVALAGRQYATAIWPLPQASPGTAGITDSMPQTEYFADRSKDSLTHQPCTTRDGVTIREGNVTRGVPCCCEPFGCHTITRWCLLRFQKILAFAVRSTFSFNCALLTLTCDKGDTLLPRAEGGACRARGDTCMSQKHLGIFSVEDLHRSRRGPLAC